MSIPTSDSFCSIISHIIFLCNWPITETGIVQATGPSWKAQRTFTNGVFRRFGVGRSLFETEICSELETLFKEFEDTHGASFDPTRLIQIAILNIISRVTLAKKYKHGDEEFKNLKHATDIVLRFIGASGFKLLFKILRLMPSKADKMFEKARSDFIGIINRNIERRKSEFDSEAATECLVDVYLKKKHEKEDLGPYLNNETIRVLVGSLFVAGSDTSTCQILWVLIYLLRHPKVLNSVRQEVDKVVGRDRLPTMDDQAYMPFTQAVINECLRICAPAPMGLMHATSDDTTLYGYTIPKGTLVMANIWGVHHDPDTWTRPNHFDPGRFLDKKGQLVENDNVIPFSTGRQNN